MALHSSNLNYSRGESEQLGACTMREYFKARIGYGEQEVGRLGGHSEQGERLKVDICKVNINGPTSRTARRRYEGLFW